jgi:hypothetical protein
VNVNTAETPTGPAEAETLCRDTLRRLESAELLTDILPALRRLAELVGRPVAVLWLTWEITGYSKQEATPDPVRVQAYRIYAALHTAPDTIELVNMLMQERGPSVLALELLRKQVRQVLIAGPMASLERPSRLGTVNNGQGQQDAWQNLRESVNQASITEVIQRVKEAVHSFASAELRTLAAHRDYVTVLGVDAVTVFSAAGPLLERLSDAVSDLGWPGHEESACLAARSALERMGLDLYTGDGKPYLSPIDQRMYSPLQSETHRLHAVIDQLWLQVGDERRQRELELAHKSLQRVRDTAGRAKTQPIAHTDAEQAVTDAYQVAHAICFAGGFPARQPEER